MLTDLVAMPGQTRPGHRLLIALLFKAKAPRFKDQRDFDRVLPHLDQAARNWLASALEQAHPDHPWHARVLGAQA